MKWEVIQGDCLEIMPTLGMVDACITDPPYGLDFREHEWDKDIPAWFGIAQKMAKIVAFTTAPTTQWDYPRPDWVNCWYREAANSRTHNGGFNHWSPVLIYGSPFFQVDSLKLHAIQHATSKEIDHPTPKPIALALWLVKNCTEQGETVLDPFCGSGTFGEACVLLGRNFIGIERELPYVEIARARIKRAQGIAVDIPRVQRVERDLPLFPNGNVSEAAKAVQAQAAP